jgi:hypothetical protein
VQTLDDLHSWKVSVLAQTGLSFDLSTASGKLMRTIMAGLAEFERYVESMVIGSPCPADRRLTFLSTDPPTRKPSACSPCTATGCPTA